MSDVAVEEKILSDDIIKSPHKKRKDLSARKGDRYTEGVKIWTSFWRLILVSFLSKKIKQIELPGHP